VDGVNVVPEVYEVKNKIKTHMKLFRVQEPVLLASVLDVQYGIGGGQIWGLQWQLKRFL
jgi:hypothetical protein